VDQRGTAKSYGFEKKTILIYYFPMKSILIALIFMTSVNSHAGDLLDQYLVAVRGLVREAILKEQTTGTGNPADVEVLADYLTDKARERLAIKAETIEGSNLLQLENSRAFLENEFLEAGNGEMDDIKPGYRFSVLERYVLIVDEIHSRLEPAQNELFRIKSNRGTKRATFFLAGVAVLTGLGAFHASSAYIGATALFEAIVAIGIFRLRRPPPESSVIISEDHFENWSKALRSSIQIQTHLRNLPQDLDSLQVICFGPDKSGWMFSP